MEGALVTLEMANEFDSTQRIWKYRAFTSISSTHLTSARRFSPRTLSPLSLSSSTILITLELVRDQHLNDDILRRDDNISIIKEAITPQPITQHSVRSSEEVNADAESTTAPAVLMLLGLRLETIF